MDYRDIFQANYLNSGVNGIQAMENDGMGRPVYIGYAKAGTAKDKIGWQIRKLTYDANSAVTDVQFASGTAEFDKIWDSRAGYSYS